MHIHEARGLFQLQLRADGRSGSTQMQYERHTLMFETWLAASGRSMDLRDIDHVAVAEFLTSDVVREKRGGGLRKATSTNGIRTSLRCFFRWAHAAGYSPLNAAA